MLPGAGRDVGEGRGISARVRMILLTMSQHLRTTRQTGISSLFIAVR